MDADIATGDQKGAAQPLQEDAQEKRALAPDGAGDPAERRRARAKRFGIKLEPEPEPIDPSRDLPDIPDARLRPKAVHLHGTDEMSTEDVLAYFEPYSPSKIEWINDSSCNVVWADSGSALRALLGLSTELPSSPEQGSPVADMSEAVSGEDGDQAAETAQQQGTGMETGTNQNQELESEGTPGTGPGTGGTEGGEGGDGNRTVGGGAGEEESAGGGIWSGRTEERRDERSSSEDSEDCREDSVRRTRTATKEGENDDDSAHALCWRCGQPHPKAGRLLLRLATEADVKERGAAKRSAYYRKYGRPGDTRQEEREGWEEGEEERWGFKSGAGRKSKKLWGNTWREEGEEEEEEWQEDLRVRLGKKHSLKRDKEEEEEDAEPMEMDIEDRPPAEPSPFASLAKRPKPMHSDRPSDLLDATEMMDESEKQRRLSELQATGKGGLGGGRGDLRRALQQRKKRRNLMLRLGHTPRLVERKN